MNRRGFFAGLMGSAVAAPAVGSAEPKDEPYGLLDPDLRIDETQAALDGELRTYSHCLTWAGGRGESEPWRVGDRVSMSAGQYDLPVKIVAEMHWRSTSDGILMQSVIFEPAGKPIMYTTEEEMARYRERRHSQWIAEQLLLELSRDGNHKGAAIMSRVYQRICS